MLSMDFFLKKNDINEINRAKLMMKYQTSKTFSENLLTINEQSTAGYIPPQNLTPEKERKLDYEIKQKEKNAYPNYCPY